MEFGKKHIAKITSVGILIFKEGEFDPMAITPIHTAIMLMAVFTIAGRSQSKPIRFDGRLLAVSPVVTGHPLSASKTVTSNANMPDGSVRSSTHVYTISRDSQGRTVSAPARAASGYNPMLTEFDDPVGGYFYILDARTKTAYRSKMPALLTRKPSPSSAQSIGNQYILGVQASGEKTFTNGGYNEKWYCNELNLLMRYTFSIASGSGTEEITSLQLVEPSAAQFQVPQGYTVVDESGPFEVN